MLITLGVHDHKISVLLFRPVILFATSIVLYLGDESDK